jgi:hypothetical protein
VTAKPAQSFSDLEAVKIALGMEKDGLAFYQAAAGASPPGELRSTFEMLADEERKHLAIFEDMAGEMARAKREEYWDDPDVEAYVHAVVGQKIFPPKAPRACPMRPMRCVSRCRPRRTRCSTTRSAPSRPAATRSALPLTV